MSLRVWLPLTGDLRNNGLSNTTITNNGSVVDDNGKIGKCYKFVSSSSNETSYLQLGPNFMTSFTECSVCFWFNIISWNTNYATLFQAGFGSQPWSSYGFGILRNGSNSNLCFPISDGTNSTGSACYTTVSFSTDIWYHITCVYSNGHCKVYVNGQLNRDYETSIVPAFSNINTITIGKCNNKTAYQSNCMMNDLRIYDHALSLKEVKEISKGLVCHYNLCDQYSTTNLIRNGFGEGGNENWKGVNVYTDDLPTDDSNVKAKFTVTGIGENIDYIPINVNHSYTVSMYIKKATASGTAYPGFFPYDYDKKPINAFNNTEGFNNTYKTTLAQPLKTGDTVIYATDLSTWTTNNNYYYYVAIFGYKDSGGHLYPDMFYTADSPAFGTLNDKSNIDKTNNTITLLAPFAGKDRPAGTAICQATAGSSYYYPFGAVDMDTVTEWTYKTYTFTPSKINKLKASKYLRFRLGTRGYQAGIKLVDNTNNAVVYDSSGYNNHGEIYAYNAKGNIVTSSDTPRNSISTFINSDDNTTHTASGTVFIYGNCKLETPRQLTITFWCKPIAGYLGGTGQGQFCTTNYDCGITAGRDHNATAMHHRDNAIDVTNIDGTDKRLSIGFTASEWHHYAFVYNGRYCRSYRDGVEQASIDMGTEISLKSFKAVVIGYSNAGGVYRSNKSYYSDFRVYTTALSVDDILELYHTPISVSKTGETFTQGEYIET